MASAMASCQGTLLYKTDRGFHLLESPMCAIILGKNNFKSSKGKKEETKMDKANIKYCSIPIKL